MKEGNEMTQMPVHLFLYNERSNFFVDSHLLAAMTFTLNNQS